MYYFGLLIVERLFYHPHNTLCDSTHTGGLDYIKWVFPAYYSCLTRRCPLWKVRAILIPWIHRSQMLRQLVSLLLDSLFTLTFISGVSSRIT